MQIPVPLVVRPVVPRIDGPTLPMMFDISMGVHRDEPEFKRLVEEALTRDRVAIDTILSEYGIPRRDPPRRGS